MGANHTLRHQLGRQLEHWGDSLVYGRKVRTVVWHKVRPWFGWKRPKTTPLTLETADAILKEVLLGEDNE